MIMCNDHFELVACRLCHHNLCNRNRASDSDNQPRIQATWEEEKWPYIYPLFAHA